MSEVLYRFRSTHNLLDGYKELENQEIYFAPPSQLNDPMEGFRDFFWSGDAIVWKNFLIHYLLCLEHCFTLAVIGGEQNPVDKTHIPLYKTPEDFPTPMYSEFFTNVCTAFFSEELIKDLPSKLAQRKTRIRRNELLFHLSWIHPIAVEAIYSSYQARGLFKERRKKDTYPPIFREKDIFEALNQAPDEVAEAETMLECLFIYQAMFNKQINLIVRYNEGVDADKNNEYFIFTEFPEAYINEVERLVYADWYTACFMGECTNSSVWGHYGDNHKGVCLVYGVESGDSKGLNLHGISGFNMNGPTKSVRKYPFEKVAYDRPHVENDFFRSLGTLTVPNINKYWYTDSEGNRSICGDVIAVDADEWRKTYWKKFTEGVTTKASDWAYEKEYRIVLHGWLNDYSNKDDRKLKYNFCDLKGIIFGINTTTEDKLKIIEIIDSKCKAEGREDFKFYQAYYSHTKGTIEHAPMSFIKVV